MFACESRIRQRIQFTSLVEYFSSILLERLSLKNCSHWTIEFTEELQLLLNLLNNWTIEFTEASSPVNLLLISTVCRYPWFGRSVCFLRFDMIKIIVRPLLALAISIAPDVSLQSPTRSDLSFWKERQRAGDSQTAQMSSANTFGSMAHLTERNWEWNW
jgi:hypothetical protein